jgi:hypothetical protein
VNTNSKPVRIPFNVEDRPLPELFVDSSSRPGRRRILVWRPLPFPWTTSPPIAGAAPSGSGGVDAMAKAEASPAAGPIATRRGARR